MRCELASRRVTHVVAAASEPRPWRLAIRQRHGRTGGDLPRQQEEWAGRNTTGGVRRMRAQTYDPLGLCVARQPPPCLHCKGDQEVEARRAAWSIRKERGRTRGDVVLCETRVPPRGFTTGAWWGTTAGKPGLTLLALYSGWTAYPRRANHLPFMRDGRGQMQHPWHLDEVAIVVERAGRAGDGDPDQNKKVGAVGGSSAEEIRSINFGERAK